MIDASGCEGRDPVEDFKRINEELVEYGGLSDRMQIVAANKTDIYDAHENVQRLHEYLDPLGIEIFEVSAATRQGFTPLLKRIAQVLPTLPEPASMEDLPEETLDEKTLGEQFTIYREHGEFFVDGPGAQRLIDSVNFDDEESVNWLMGIKCLKGCGMSIEDIKRYGDLCLQGDETLAERREIMNRQLALARQKLKEAQEIFDYITKKVAHYDDVIAGKTTDDTNPSTRILPSKNCCK